MPEFKTKGESGWSPRVVKVYRNGEWVPVNNVTTTSSDSTTDSTAPAISPKEITERASSAATYYHGPQGEYVASEDKTFVVWRGVEADPYAVTYDHAAGTFVDRVWLASNPLDNTDEHGPPSLAVDPSGDIHSFFGAHGGDVEYIKSAETYQTSKWTSPSTLTGIPGGTYPSMDADSTGVYAMYRTGNHNPGGAYPQHAYATIVESTDGGSTWSDLGPILDTTGHPDSDSDAYIADMDIRDGVLHFTWTVAHGTSHNDSRDDVYHGYYDRADETCYAYDGTELGASITWADHDACRVYSGPASAGYHAFDGSTWYILVMTEPSDGGRGYVLLEWDGSSWSQTDTGASLAAGGSTTGIRVNSNGNPELHLVTGDGTNTAAEGGAYERYIRRDGAWTTDTVVEEAEDDIIRIDVPRDADDDLAGLASAGGSDTDWSLPFRGAGAFADYAPPGITVVEDFETSGGYTESGSTSGSYSRQSTTVLEGDTTLEVSGSNYAIETTDRPTINLGETVRWRTRYAESRTTVQQFNLYLLESGGFPTDGNGYRFIIFDDETNKLSLKIERRDSGSPTTLKQTELSTSAPGTDLFVELITGLDNRFALRLFDVNGDHIGTVTTVDGSGSYSSFDKIGWNVYGADGSTVTAYFDYLHTPSW